MTSSKATKKENTPEKVEERVAPTPPRKRNPIYVIGLVGLCAIGFLWAIIATFTDFGRTMHPNQATDTTKSSGSEKVERSVSGESVEQDKKDALAAATEILNLSGKSPTGASAENRMKALDKGDTSVVDKSLPGLIQFSSQSENGYKMATYQTLLTINNVVGEKMGKKLIAPVDSNAYQNVAVDQKIGTAYVPLDTYTKNGAAFSMAMVYVDGKWKLAPYTLIDAIRFSAATAQNMAGANGNSGTASK